MDHTRHQQQFPTGSCMPQHVQNPCVPVASAATQNNAASLHPPSSSSGRPPLLSSGTVPFLTMTHSQFHPNGSMNASFMRPPQLPVAAPAPFESTPNPLAPQPHMAPQVVVQTPLIQNFVTTNFAVNAAALPDPNCGGNLRVAVELNLPVHQPRNNPIMPNTVAVTNTTFPTQGNRYSTGMNSRNPVRNVARNNSLNTNVMNTSCYNAYGNNPVENSKKSQINMVLTQQQAHNTINPAQISLASSKNDSLQSVEVGKKIRHVLLVGYKKAGESKTSNDENSNNIANSKTTTGARTLQTDLVTMPSDGNGITQQLFRDEKNVRFHTTEASIQRVVTNDTAIDPADLQGRNMANENKNLHMKQQSGITCTSRLNGANAPLHNLLLGSNRTGENIAVNPNFASTQDNRHLHAPHNQSIPSTTIAHSKCSYNLNPAPIPQNVITDDWTDATHLECELAWLVEESAFIVPNSQESNDKSDLPSVKQTSESVPLALEFAWAHGSVILREKLLVLFPSELDAGPILQNKSRVPSLNRVHRGNQTLVDISALFSQAKNGTNGNATTEQSRLEQESTEKFNRLRLEARQALRLGYRRDDSISEELDAIHKARWREAVGETNEQNKPTRHRRNRYSRLQNGDKVLDFAASDVSKFLQSAWQDSSNSSEPSTQEIQVNNLSVATWIPYQLTEGEDEIAWLCEESLILLPDDILHSNHTTSQHQNGTAKDGEQVDLSAPAANQNAIIVSTTSAGLVTEAPDINWDYVIKHASQPLKDELEKKGVSSTRRPHRILQRIIRYHDKSVKTAFLKRRDQIANLILIGGYRRSSTAEFLPSHKLLVKIGMAQILAVRRMRWRHFQGEEEMPSSSDLRSACNARLCDKSSREVKKRNKPREKRRPEHINLFPHSSKRTKTSEPLVKHPILSAEEEEIAWLREEYEIETGGLKGFDWDYIEEYASPHLMETMAEKYVALSKFPTIAGVSKLLTLVRLMDPVVERAFSQKRADVRRAIHEGFRRNLLSKHLPYIPKAPTTAPVNGTRVIDLELPMVVYPESKVVSTITKWQCSICREEIFDTLAEAEEHEADCSGASKREKIESFQWKCTGCDATLGGDFDSVFNHERICKTNSDEKLPEMDTSKLQNDSHSKYVKKWRCEVCRVEIFDSFEEAQDHELHCTAIQSNRYTKIASKGVDSCKGEVASALADLNSQEPKHAQKWRCDVCHVKIFDSFEEAQDHERKCTAGSLMGDEKISSNDIDSRSDEGVVDLASSQVNNPQQWRCDFCRVKLFDTFKEAEQHERECLAAPQFKAAGILQPQEDKDVATEKGSGNAGRNFVREARAFELCRSENLSSRGDADCHKESGEGEDDVCAEASSSVQERIQNSWSEDFKGDEDGRYRPNSDHEDEVDESAG